jgi:oxygen-independent coproporphyrinogen-3 oxidase
VSSEPSSVRTLPLGIYLHFPFCVAHCTYCDFYKRLVAEGDQARSFARALAASIPLSAQRHGITGRPADTVYFGGGTPSLLNGNELGAILDVLRSIFRLDAHAEITLECNPESATAQTLRGFRERGVNRLSLGVQSFDDGVLATLGRAHSAARARQAFREARQAGFDNLSLDLMLALPGQTLDTVRRDVDACVELAPEHLSTYLLEMDKETALRARIERGELASPSEDEAGDMYELVRAGLTGAGYAHYEVSNFALAGSACRHNLKYWTDQPFVGFGPSAWSYLEGGRFREAPDVEGFLVAVGNGEAPVIDKVAGGTRERMAEALFAGLRLVRGVDLERLAREYRAGNLLAEFGPALREMEAAGLVVIEGSRLRLTARGFPIANEVFQVFV